MSLNRRLANLGKVIDSATTGHFLSKGDSDGQFSTVAYSSISGTPSVVLDSALTTQLVDSSYIQLRQTSGTAGLDSALITSLVDSSYVAARAGSGGGGSGFVKYQYTATDNQTTFQDSDDAGQILSYTEDYILVHYNGVSLPASDYTASSGSSVVLGTGADSGAIISIAKWSAASSGSSGLSFTGNRGIVHSGNVSGSSNHQTIYYIDITTPGNASSFGSLSTSHGNTGPSGASNGSRGVMGGGGAYNNANNIIDYITISTPGNAVDFGDLTVARYGNDAASDATRGIFAGGYSNTAHNQIDYVTIANTGNATDFGDLQNIATATGAGANSTRAIFSQLTYIEYITKDTAGNAAAFGTKHTDQGTKQGTVGDETYHLMCGGTAASGSPSYSQEIHYVNWATLGNATNWGYETLTAKASGSQGVENPAGRGVLCGGFEVTGGSSVDHNTMQYLTIAVPSDCTDFGDLAGTHSYPRGYSGT